MNKLIHGDCFVELQKIQDKSVDMIFIDPPYGNTWLKWDKVVDFKLLWKEFNRIKKNKHTPILIFSSGKFTPILQNSNIKNYRYPIIWVKNRPTDSLNSNRKPLNNTEFINVFYEKQPIYNPQKTHLDTYSKKYLKTWNKKKEQEYMYDSNNFPKDILLNNVGKFPLQTQNWDYLHSSKKLHPTEKPQPVLEWLIKTYTNKGDIVLDCFMGSGSTGVACKTLERQFIGIEIDEKYFNIAKERIENE